MDPETLAELEELAWATYLDARDRDEKPSPRVFERWRTLWKARDLEIPLGAWDSC